MYAVVWLEMLYAYEHLSDTFCYEYALKQPQIQFHVEKEKFACISNYVCCRLIEFLIKRPSLKANSRSVSFIALLFAVCTNSSVSDTTIQTKGK